MAKRKIDPDEKRPSWRERRAALRYVPPLVKLVWQTHSGYTVAMIALRLVRSVVPVATLWVGKLIIDEVVGQIKQPHELTKLWQYVAMEIAIVLGSEAL